VEITDSRGAVVGNVTGMISIALKEGTDGISAGNHFAAASINNPNYTIAEGAEFEYAIGKAELTVLWTVDTFFYNGLVQLPRATGVAVFGGRGAIVGSPAAIVALIQVGAANGSAAITATNHTAVATLDTDNYALVDNTHRLYNIRQAELTLTWQEASDYFFNGAVQMPTVDTVAVANGRGPASLNLVEILASLNGSITLNRGNGKDAGNHTAQASIADTNYRIVDNATFQYNIKQAELVIHWNAVTNFFYTGEVQTPSIANLSIWGGRGPTPFASMLNPNPAQLLSQIEVKLMSGNGINAGSHVAYAAVGNANFRVALEGNGSLGYTINKAHVALEWSNGTFTFNGTVQAPTVVGAAIVDGQGVLADAEAFIAGLTLALSNGGINAGNYTAFVSALGNANFEIASGASTSYTINRAVFVPQNVTVVFDGNPHTIEHPVGGGFAVSVARRANGGGNDNSQGNSNSQGGGNSAPVQGTSFTQVGVYTFTFRILFDQNYTDATVTATLTIQQASAQALQTLVDTYGAENLSRFGVEVVSKTTDDSGNVTFVLNAGENFAADTVTVTLNSGRSGGLFGNALVVGLGALGVILLLALIAYIGSRGKCARSKIVKRMR
jgi:hypothetical protein